MPAAQRDELARAGALRCRYLAPGGVAYEVEVSGGGDSLKIALQREGAAPRAGGRRGAASETSRKVSRRRPEREARRERAEPAPRDSLEPRPPRALESLLAAALERGASDIMLSSGTYPRARVGGDFLPIGSHDHSDELISAFVEEALTDELRARFEREGSVDMPMTVTVKHSPRRMRANLFRQFRGLALALRPIREIVPKLRELGLPENLGELTDYPNGLVLLCGPTGSGKSTTLAALIRRINYGRPRHVITIEDPIEYIHNPRKQSLIHQREVGVHVSSFAAGLRAALRESPDIILLGEMRDHDTIAAALTAAETGHLVLSTLHSANAAMAIDRIIDVFPAHQQRQVRIQLAAVLRATVTQVLLPASGGQRLPAIEKMIVTPAIAAKIREERVHQLASDIQTGKADGMVTLEQSLAALVRAGKVKPAVARLAARNPRALEELLRI